MTCDLQTLASDADQALFQGDYHTSQSLIQQVASETNQIPKTDFILAALLYAQGHHHAAITLGCARLRTLSPKITGPLLSGDQLARFLQGKIDLKPNRQTDLELVMFTHATKKPAARPYQIPPSTDLVSATLRSTLNALNTEPKVTLLVDNWETANSEDYCKNLKLLSEKEGFELLVSNQYGLRKQWLRMAEHVTSEFVILMEHDWLFHANMANAQQLIAIMLNNPLLNHIRFNKRENIQAGWDRRITKDFLHHTNDVTLTTSFSNSPHIIRTSFLKEIIVAIIGGSASSDVINGGAGGVEMQIIKYRSKLEAAIGDSFSALLFGTAMLGEIGTGARVRHIG